MKIGIDKIGFYVPHTYLAMEDLAQARQIEYAKYQFGLGQEEMAVAPLYEDAVTLAANAALAIVSDEDRQAIDLVLVGSESGVDNSKSIATYLQSLVGLSDKIRAVELKQACYGATMALQLAKGHIALHPNSKVLVVATDIAKYGIETAGEPTQGAGAVAMIVSANPKIATLGDVSTCLTQDIMDFWRPVYSDVAFAKGRYSMEQYIYFFESVIQDYLTQTQSQLEQFAALCFHIPYTKLGYKALSGYLEKTTISAEHKALLLARYEESKYYSTRIGNIYTGSLYLGLLSLLDRCQQLKAGDIIGLFSYGSGAVGEFFTLTLVEGYTYQLNEHRHEALLNNRKQLTVAEYETYMQASLPKDGSTYDVANVARTGVVLTRVSEHQRYYERR